MDRTSLLVLLTVLLAPTLPAQPAEPVRLEIEAPFGFASAELPLARPAHAPTPAASSGIGPGALLLLSIPEDGNFLCTANFVWGSGSTLYLGAAGHCFLPNAFTATHGAGANYDASGVVTKVCVSSCTFGGATASAFRGTFVELGRVAYARQTGPGGDVGNDFGLVEIPASLQSQVRPNMPVWLGPTTSAPALVTSGGALCTYGNGLLTGETLATKARAGAGLAGTPSLGRWNASLPVNRGDSGAAVVTCGSHPGGVHGIAPAGIITHGTAAPLVGLGLPVLAFGTTAAKAQLLAAEAGLNVQVVV